MVLSEAHKKGYLKRGGNRCPYPRCSSGDLRTLGQPKGDDGGVTQDVQCFSCGKIWTDIYTLSDIEG